MTDSVPSTFRPHWIRRSAVSALILGVIGGIVLVWGIGSDTQNSPTPPPIVYFAPADVYAPDLVVFENDSAHLLTDRDDEILDYAISPEGDQIAFSRSNPDGTIDIWLVDVATEKIRPLTDCVKARCIAPAWHPDGTLIAYQRNDTNPATGRTEPRVWIVDVQTAESRLLSDDLQQHGESPTWNGQRIAVYDETLPGLRILDMESDSSVLIENSHDKVGRFSPDGSRFVYPVLVRGALGETFYTQLELFDFETMTIERISGGADTPVEDVFAAWSPDGTQLLLARRYLDERYTSGTQIYTLTVESGDAEPLVLDAAYNLAAMSYDSSGRWVVFQRFSLVESGAQPEIWLYDTKSGEQTRIAENAFSPAFVE